VAWRLCDHAGAEITKADTKAGLALTIELAALAAVIDGRAGSGGAALWAGGLCLAAAVVLAVLVVLPAMPPRGRPDADHWLHFGAVRRLSAAELAARLRDVNVLDPACRQARALSAIAHRKLTWLRWSLLAAVPGVLLVAAATAGLGGGVR
jgi:hypothetical protein